MSDLAVPGLQVMVNTHEVVGGEYEHAFWSIIGREAGMWTVSSQEKCNRL